MSASIHVGDESWCVLKQAKLPERMKLTLLKLNLEAFGLSCLFEFRIKHGLWMRIARKDLEPMAVPYLSWMEASLVEVYRFDIHCLDASG